MIYFIFLALICLIAWLLLSRIPRKYRYLVWILLIILIITSFAGSYSYRWHRMTSQISQMAR